MDDIITMVVSNGLWAVLFCGLLVFELRDSRRRELRYGETIRSLSDRLGVVNAVMNDTSDIKTDAHRIKADTDVIRADTGAIRRKLRKSAGADPCAG